MDIFVLGISTFAHESSACLLKNGRVVAFAEEERFNRDRHTSSFPIQAIQFCLSRGDISISELSQVTFFWKPKIEILGNALHFVRYLPSSWNLLSAPGGTTSFTFFERMGLMMRLQKVLKRYFPEHKIPPIYFCEHHNAHAASAFYSSPFSEAAILTMDGRGECVTTAFSKGSRSQMQRLFEVPVPHSLGHFYSSITDFLGFKPFFDEWKVMGLSAYGTDRYEDLFSELIRIKGHGFELNLDYFSFHTHGTKKWLSDKFYEAIPRPKDGDFQNSADIAWAAQRCVERMGLHLARQLREMTNSDTLCVAGGVALNCLMNQKIVEQSGFEKFYFQPIANDAGTSLGSAQHWYHHVRGNQKWNDQPHQDDLAWGPAFSSQQCETLLKKYKLSYQRAPDFVAQAAQLLYQGKVIGWFQGGMEGGPRALGHRSILADPTRKDMKEKINQIVKKRETFRPFAPSVLLEKAKEYFEMPKDLPSPHMILTGNVRKEWSSRLPAITHVDGTARVQTVSKMHHPLFHSLIEKFGELSGVSVLLNTSFNENEPIVCNPQEAIECFLRSDLDALFLEDLVVIK
jgi:carbamoyltransferase